MQTIIKYMKNSIIETISETTDENLVRYIYTMLMEAKLSTEEKLTEKQQADF